MKEKLLELADAIQQAAPEVWKAAMQRAVANMVLEAFWSLVFLVISIICWKQVQKRPKEDDWRGGFVILSFLFLVLGLVFCSWALKTMFSLRWEAIEIIRSLIR